MACLSFTRGEPVAEVIGGDLDGDIIHLYDPDLHGAPNRGKPVKGFPFIRFQDAKIFPIPSRRPEQIYISGPNGSGKTYYAARYLKRLRKLQPKRPIYVFSDLKDDELLDKIKGVQRVNIDRELVDEPITPEQLEGSIVVFDDVDSIQDKAILREVLNLRDRLLKTSRHSDVYVVCTNHLSCDYKATRTLINECRSITVFPKSGAANQIQRIFKEYCGLTTKQIEYIMGLPSRWVTLHKNYPMYVTYDNGIALL